MTRIKHAEWAYEYIRQAEDLFDPNETDSRDDATVAELTAIGQVHATLALVEQQRIANLLATAHIDSRYFENEKIAELREELGL